MSGPKLSQAEIERMRQEQLERERLAALKRLQDAQGQYRRVCDKVEAIKTDAMNTLDRVNAVYRSVLQANIVQVLNRLVVISVADKKNPESYHEATKKMETTIEEVSVDLDVLLGKMVKRDTTDKTLKDANTAYQTIMVMVDAMGKEIMPIKMDFSSQYDVAKRGKEIELLYSHYNVLSKRSDVPNHQKFARIAEKKLQTLMSDDKNLSNGKKVDAFLQELINEEQELIRQWNVRKELLDEYLALAAITDTVPRNPNDFDSEDLIRNQEIEVYI